MVSVELHEHEEEEEELPAWSLPAEAVDRIRVPVTLPEQVTREWAWGGSTGAGVRVGILDSGIELDHPLVGRVDRSVAVLRRDVAQPAVGSAVPQRQIVSRLVHAMRLGARSDVRSFM